MSANNLAIVFGPNIFSCPSLDPLKVMEHTPKCNNCVKKMIEEGDGLFEPGQESGWVAGE